MAETLRAFIAIEVPEAARRQLEAAIQRLQDEGVSGVRWVRPDGIHLTLKFLGEIEAARTEAILKGMAEAVVGSGPFELSLVGVGAFPSLRRPRVVWLGLGGDLEVLSALQGRVEDEVAQLGFPRERRPFSPHLTLGRVRGDAGSVDTGGLERAASAVSMESEMGWRVGEVCLIRSTLLPSGARYDRLGVVTLRG